MLAMICLRDNPRSLGRRLIVWNTFVAMMVSSRLAKSRTARPRISSLTPIEYTSAVSKKLMPLSKAFCRKGRPSSSSKTQSRQRLVP